MAVKKSLGRGLGALLSDSDDFLQSFEERETRETGGNRGNDAGQIEIPISDIVRNEDQPRKTFDEAAMSELVNSIRIHGVITPIIVVKKDSRYMIIAGERRWRAARKAGLSTIPAIVRNYSALQIKEIALIENLQREDLNPIETATAVKQLMQDYNYTQEAVAERIGKSRSAVANALGLLTLAGPVIDLVATGRLSPGHAKILTAIEDPKLQYELALKGADGKMSVRKFEQIVKDVKNPNASGPQSASELSLELKDLVFSMQRVFATKVSAIGSDKKGRIYIDYYSRDDLDRLVELIDLIKTGKSEK